MVHTPGWEGSVGLQGCALALDRTDTHAACCIVLVPTARSEILCLEGIRIVDSACFFDLDLDEIVGIALFL
jgi:hypothetical protein